MYNRGGGRGGGGGGKVCEFFLQGRCKYGDNCKFDHPASQSTSTNRFAALSNANTGRGRAGDAKEALPYSLSKDIIVDDLKNDRPTWPFSAYGPGREAPRQLISGYPLEQSPEEMRLIYYRAQASGNVQPAVQAEQELFQQMNQQIEKILSDPEGAIRYVVDGADEHPNRRDMAKAASTQGAAPPANPFSTTNNTGTFGQPSNMGGTSAFGQPSQSGGSTAFPQPSQSGTTSGFGQPSQMGSRPAFGQPSQPGVSAFGQPSQPGANTAFGQPSQPGQTSAFGQPSQMSAQPAFGRPSQPAASTAFGQPSQPGGATAFGQPSQPGGNTAFGQPSQPGAPSAFGQASAPVTTGGFGQPSAMGQSKPAFGQASQASNSFSAQKSTTGFGQPSQPNQSSPFAAASQAQATTTPAFGKPTFGQPSQSPFASAATNQQNASPFAAPPSQTQPSAASNPFGQPSQPAQPVSSPFAQANTSSTIKSPFTNPHAHPTSSTVATSTPGPDMPTATPPLASYAQQVNGRLSSWRNSPVTYIEGAPYYSKTGNVNNEASLERIWFPDGAPGANAYTMEAEDIYALAGPGVEEVYRRCAEVGIGGFEGIVPMLAPRREWVRFDL